jgi:hypothetical protein
MDIEELLDEVAYIRSAAGSAARLAINELEGMDDRVGRCMDFIYNLSGDIEDYLESFKEDKNAELSFGFLCNEGIDPWSLFGDTPY